MKEYGAEMKLVILMAVYNGEGYIEEQINSILTQTYSNWTLYIRDDGSDDRTKSIIIDYSNKYPDKIKIITRTIDKHGSKYNFWTLCEEAETDNFDCIMFCDQDDYWNSNKIEVSLEAMENAKKQFGEIPILVHTDLSVTDAELNIIGNSFIDYRALDPSANTIEKLMVQNNVTGCTVLINDLLLKKAMAAKNVDNIAMHDWWISVVAALFGKIIFIDEKTVKYRQHGNNVVGATKVNTISFILKRLTGHAHVKETLYLAELQASELLNTYDKELDCKNKKLIEIFSQLPNKNKVARIYIIFRYGILKQGLIQKIGEIIFI